MLSFYTSIQNPTMARSIGFLIVLLLVVSGFDMAHMYVYDPGCDRVYQYFPYCLDFLVGFYYKPSKKCCQHIEKINILAKHRLGPRYVCWCIQDTVKGLQPPVIASNIQALPSKCHTNLSFPISESIDCTKYTHPSLPLSLSQKIKKINKYIQIRINCNVKKHNIFHSY